MSSNRRGWIAAALASLCLAGSFGCADAAPPGREPVVGLPCDGCEAVFETAELVTRDIVLGAGIPGYPAAAPK